MMRRIVASSLKFRRLVVAVAAGMLVFGVTQLRHVPVDQLPEFGPTMVEVRTEALGLSAAEVEQLITVPLEQDLLNGIAFLDEIHSESVPGLSSVVMIFEPGTPLLDARQVVQEKVSEAAVALPGVSAPPQMLQPLSSASRVMAVRLSSDTLPPLEVSELARWNVGPRLLGVPGVANVSMWGWRDRQLQVLVDPERLRDSDLTLQQIVETTGNSLWASPLTFLEASTPGTAGFIDTPNQRFGIRHELPIKTAEDLAEVPIQDEHGDAVIVDGDPISLGEVTEVVEDHQPLIGDALFPEGPQGLLLVIEKFPDANTLEVTHGVEEAFEELAPGLGDVQVDTSLFRPASSIERATDNLGTSLLIGAILLVLALALMHFDWRATLVSTLAIFVSLVAAGTVIYFAEVPVNLMLLAGLVMAVAIVVDDAVNDVRHVVARLRRRSVEEPGTPVWRTFLEASVEMRSSLLYATLIVGATMLPGFFLEGQTGTFLPPIAFTYLLAVAASMVVALVLTPALGMMLLSKASTEGSPVVRWFERRHQGIASRMVRRPRWGYAAIGIVVVAGLATFPFLERSSSVTLKENDLVVHWDAAPGTSLPAMSRVTMEAVEELRALPGIRDVSAHVGRAIHSDQVVGINSGQIWLNLDPSANAEATTAAIEGVLDGYPELTHDLSTYPEDRITDVLQGTDEDVVVRLFGADTRVLRDKAREVRTVLSEIAGVEGDARVELPPMEPTIEVEVDLERAQRFGVVPGDVRRASAILLSGLAVGNLFEERKVFDVVVWGTPDIRQNVADVRALPIDTPTGDQVLLGQVAEVRVVPNPTVIRHESVSNYVDISASIGDRDADAVVADVERALTRVDLPFEYHTEILGEYASEQASQARIVAVAIAAAVAVFLLLQAAFTSWRLATLVFLTLPLALVGGLIAAAIAGGTIGLGSFAGLLAIVGIAARSGVLQIRRYQELERREDHAFGSELVLRGTRDRLSPTLIAAIASILALVPLAVAGDVAGMEIVRPMAIVMIGGLVTSTALTLIVIPALYLLHGFVAQRDFVADDLIVLPEAQVEVERVPGN
ncbi:MAG: efflux RND transporter permease subunit [Actinomycetota bacterium]|nr:efflux RND transporter permease subunit [Actinomycetota bacterium]